MQFSWMKGSRRSSSRLDMPGGEPSRSTITKCSNAASRRPKPTVNWRRSRDAQVPKLCAKGWLESALAPVVHGDCTIAERRRRDQLQLSRTGQPALVQGRAVASDSGMDEELVLIDQIQPVQLGREFAATEEHARRSR